ncbi:MAG: type II toxin-antitoxin system RelE/ParE family toxin [Magnetococcales bacterium]|nr:type II toxin-antitoxin system RelE/ParE family toxin [Magnetococcales bacterium]
MSSHKHQIDLSDAAQRDFRDILSYTLRTWGEPQFIEYKNLLDSALNAISINPESGRSNKGSAIRVFLVGRHAVYYRIENNIIYIIRILHDRMHAAWHLNE